MYFFTVFQKPKYHQISLEEFLNDENAKSYMITPNTSNTKTYCVENISQRLLSSVDVDEIINKLKLFNKHTDYLRASNRADLYNTFYIPKRSGKSFRRIDAPNDELKSSLRHLKHILENDCKLLYHTSAFAYIKHRSTIDAVKKHQANESKWFGKYDLSDFFGSTTLDFVLEMFSKIFPLSEVMKNSEGREELTKAIELAFLNGGLPQGTPISPIITNVMMIPIDFELSNKLNDYNKQKYIYTRYADDFLISSKYDFNHKEIENIINEVLKKYNAPFKINCSKTRYGSSSGSNWNLGIMLNRDNEITIGYKKKRQFEAMLTNYIRDKKAGKNYELDRLQYMEGLRSYYSMVEEKGIMRLIDHINKKNNVNVLNMIKNDITYFTK